MTDLGKGLRGEDLGKRWRRFLSTADVGSHYKGKPKLFKRPERSADYLYADGRGEAVLMIFSHVCHR